VVFAIGVLLVAGSGLAVLFKGQSLDSWAGIGLTGGTGVLGVIYGILIARPRKQVREAVDHLMYLKIVFLGYLRQLHQVDQAYTRRLLEDEPMRAEEVSKFSLMVGETMAKSVQHLARPMGAPPEAVNAGVGKTAPQGPAVHEHDLQRAGVS
jgi:hypothetical protein